MEILLLLSLLPKKVWPHQFSFVPGFVIIWTHFEAWPCPRVKTLFPFYDIVLLVLLQCSVGMEQRQDIERQLLHPTTNYSWGITFKEALPELMMEWRTLGNLYSITQKMPKLQWSKAAAQAAAVLRVLWGKLANLPLPICLTSLSCKKTICYQTVNRLLRNSASLWLESCFTHSSPTQDGLTFLLPFSRAQSI